MHSDNDIFSDQFRLGCDNKHQDLYFSGVGVHNQNTIQELTIKTIIYMARTFMVHSSLNYPDHWAYEFALWYFYVKHDVWLHNRLPNYRSSITPIEFLTSNNTEHHDLSR